MKEALTHVRVYGLTVSTVRDLSPQWHETTVCYNIRNGERDVS